MSGSVGGGNSVSDNSNTINVAFSNIDVDSISGQSSIGDEPVEISCASCLCRIDTIEVDRNNISRRKFSMIRLAIDHRLMIPLCMTCFQYVSINPNLAQPAVPAHNAYARNNNANQNNDDRSVGNENDVSDTDSDASSGAGHRRRGNRANNKNNKWKFGWRSFLTHFIITSSNAQQLRARLPYIPKTFSDLWGNAFVERLAQRNIISLPQFQHANMNVTRKIVDITNDVESFANDIDCGSYARLKSAMNKSAVATARCPFGCTEFIEKVGSISYNDFLRWVFPDVTAFRANADVHMRGARRDFTEPIEQYGFTISASVRNTVESGLVLCTCRHHNNGSAKSYVHVPQNPYGTFPSPYSDQLTPTIFAPKPFNGMKAKYSSHTWQMRTVQGGFGGLSSFSITSKPKWDIHSNHHGDLEKLYLTNRPEINSFVQSNLSDDPQAQPVLQGLQTHRLPTQEEQNTALAGATYISAPESLNLLRAMKQKVVVAIDEEEQAGNPNAGDEEIQGGDQGGNDLVDNQGGNQVAQAVIDLDDVEDGNAEVEPDDNNPQQNNPRRTNITWPLAYANANQVTNHGTLPINLNAFTGKFFPLLWSFIRLLSSIPVVWYNFAACSPIEVGDQQEVLRLVKCKAYLSTFIPGVLTSHRRNNAGAHRAKPADIQQWIKQRAQTVVGLLPDENEDEACLHTSVILSRLLHTLPNTYSCYIGSRQIPINAQFIQGRLAVLPDDEARDKCSVISICTTAAPTTQFRVARPELVIQTADGSVWELANIIRADGTAASPWDNPEGGQAGARRWTAESYLRNVGDHNLWFKDTRTKPIEYLTSDPQESLRDIIVKWHSLIYVRTSGGDLTRNKLHYLQFTGGQGTMICHDHQIPLVVTPVPKDNNGNRLLCSFQDENGLFPCNRLAKWSCPSEDCTAAYCRAHSKEVLTNAVDGPQLVYIFPRNNQDAQLDPVGDDELVDDDAAANDPLQDLIDQQQVEEGSVADQADLLFQGEFDLDDPLEMEDEEIEQVGLPGTNAADIPVTADSNTGVPGHVLLNKHYGLLNRSGISNYISARCGAFFQRLTARFAGASIPLLYPEGMLFPSIFWKSLANGTVIGALPHCLWNSPAACKKVGYASLDDHIRIRLTDPTLLTSTDPRAIQFYFDALFNLQLSHSDSRIILSRGWEHLSSDPSSFQTLQTEGRLPFSEADSRKRVNELAAEISREQPTYFYTHSCNQSEHFGVSPIFQWIEEHYRSSSEEEYNSAVQAALVPILRAWQRAGTYLMQYIETSHEQPLGPVKKLWWRWEFQTTRGNLPHIHALVWTGEDPESPAVRARVSSTRAHCFSDPQPMIDAGLISEERDIIELQELASTIHEHNCSKAGYRCCKKRDRDGKSICRFPRRPTSQGYSTKTFHVQHSKEALNILHDCGLAEIKEPFGVPELVPTEELTAKKHMYPSDEHTRFSPMNDWIFAAAKSSDNLQICTPTFTANYLAKYAAGEEERARIFLKAGKDSNSVTLQTQNLRNMKVTGAAIAAENEKSQERETTAVEARTLSLTEAVWWILNFPYVKLCSEYIHINTGFKQDRGGIVKHETQRVRPGVIAEEVPGYIARQALQFPRERQFSDSQRLTILDSMTSNITPDKISIFSSRPPELMFLQTLKDYFECVVRSAVPKSRIPRDDQGLGVQQALLRADVPDCPWIDGFDKEVKLLPAQLSRVRDAAIRYRDDARHSLSNRQLVSSIIDTILNPLLAPQPPQDLVDRFVFSKETLPRIAVFSNPLPRYADRFLIHIALSLGDFTTEVDIFSVNHLRQSYQLVGLVQDAENITNDEVNSILRRYILEQLLYLPGGTLSFDKHLVNAHSALYSLLIDGELRFYATPLVLRNEMTEAASAALVERMRQAKQSFAEALHFLSNPIHNLPPVDELVDASLTNPLQWEPELQRGATQTLESFQEQQVALNLGMRAIDDYASGQKSFVPAPILLGPPGSGKSFVTAHWGAYALAKGLSAIVTSVASERAAALGGEHIHLIFNIPVAQSLSSRILAEKALTRLARDPVKMKWLKSIRVFIHEEIGTEGAELLDVQNKILQFLHNSPLPFGGVLLMGSGDPNQLPPIKQTLLWTSPSIITTTRLYILKKFVRSATDEELQEVLTLFQKLQPTEADIQRIQYLIRERCNFRSNWDSVPTQALQIFGHREAERDAVERQLNIVKQDNTIEKVVSNSVDQYTVDGGHVWVLVNQDRVVKQINHKLQAPQSITLFIGAVMRFTCNDNSPRRAYHQSQLCVVRTLPVGNAAIVVRVAPPGRREIPATEQEFIDNGWQELTISRMFTIPQRLEGSMSVRREQYPIRHYIASTIHKVMGDTLGMVATQISDKRAKYKLWLKSQIYVIISRVGQLSNIYFVGSIEETMSAIRNLLTQSTQWDAYVRHVVGILTGAPAAGPPVIQFNTRPFRPRDTPIPPESASYVYVVVSSTNTTVSYIGQTTNLRNRLNEHNNGSIGGGARFTSLAQFWPWGLFLYVTGFDLSISKEQNRADRERVEFTWDHVSRQLHGDHPTPLQILDTWPFVFENHLQQQFPDLVLIQCADL